MKSPDKKNKSFQKQKQRLPPNEKIPSDDEDYNNPEEIDNRLDNINFIKENANQEIRPDYFEINNKNKKIEIKNDMKSDEIFEFIKNNIIKSPLFSELSFDVLTKCIDAMIGVDYKAMSEIIKQGEYSDNFYFIFKGELECRMGFTQIKKEGNRTKVEKFDPKLVKVYYPGDYFCELNLLYHIPHRASIKAISDAKLYTLDKKTYKYIINSSNIEKTKNRIELFKKMPIFETFTDEEYEQLSRISKEEIFYKGETIIRENEYMNILMIIEEGKCTGYKTIENGKMPKKTMEYKEEDFFGKTALLKEELSEESIIASSNIVKFICFDRNSIKNIFGSLEQILMRDIDIYEKYFPPIPDYTEHDQLKDNTKSIVISEGENISPNNNINPQIMEDNGDNINLNNQNIQSRDADKKNIQPEKIDSLTYGIDETSKKASKEKEEMYESEIKRLKEEVSLLKNKLGNRTYPESNNNIINENNINFSNMEFQEKIINQEHFEKEIISSNVNNNMNNMINNEINTDKIVNNDNNNLENMEPNNNINNNNFNEKSNNINIDNEIQENIINYEPNINREEINVNSNINEMNNNEINRSNNEIQNQIEEKERKERFDRYEDVNSKVNSLLESNNQNNLFNNVNDNINDDRLNRNNSINNNEEEKINNKSNSINDSKIRESSNNIQADSKGNGNRNKFKNLANLDIDDINNSMKKRTATNKSIKNLEEFPIDINNSFTNKKIKSEREIKDSTSNKID